MLEQGWSSPTMLCNVELKPHQTIRISVSTVTTYNQRSQHPRPPQGMKNDCACLTLVFGDCCYPSWTRAACAVPSTSSQELCVTVMKVHVSFLLGRCFPFSWPCITSSEDSRSEEEEEACEVHYRAASVIKCRLCRGRAEGLGVSWAAGVWGGVSLNPCLSNRCLFWEVKWVTCFFQSQTLCANTIFLALEEGFDRETKQPDSSVVALVLWSKYCSFSASSIFSTVCPWPRAKGRGLWQYFTNIFHLDTEALR